MKTALLLPVNCDPTLLVNIASQIARSRRNEFWVLQIQRRAKHEQVVVKDEPDSLSSENLRKAIQPIIGETFQWAATIDKEHSGDSETASAGLRSPRLKVKVLELCHENLVDSILTSVTFAELDLLIVPRHRKSASDARELEVIQRLFRDAPCEVMQLRPGDEKAEQIRSLLAPVGDKRSLSVSLNLAACLAAANDGEVTALHLRKDEAAEQPVAAEKIVLRRLRHHPDRVTAAIEVSDKIADGIIAKGADGFHMIVVGAAYHGSAVRQDSSSVTEEILNAPGGPTVAVVRPAIPRILRVIHAIERSAKRFVPQLDRERRVELVRRLEAHSQWNFDFIALICLSTLIAAMGLVQNSPAVVIGAMLVAPLMTPLLGAGFAIVQGNAVLAKMTARTICGGFVLAFAIGLCVGAVEKWCGFQPTMEMINRGLPNIVDLLIAFISGLVAAFAIGRPNLFSALPGVAIAAALVPPIATSGIFFSLGCWSASGGAAMLFLTNIVAIILAAACSLWLVGIRDAHAHGQFAKWVPSVAAILLVAAIALAIEASLPSGEAELRAFVAKSLTSDNDELVAVDEIPLSDGGTVIRIVVGLAGTPDEPSIAMIRRKAREIFGDDVGLHLETHYVIYQMPRK